MARLRILAPGRTKHYQAEARGRLFEQLCRNVLRHEGYDIDRSNVNYAGMEIDVEGHHRVSGIPLYAECKCHATDVDAPGFQAFFGKYMTRWFRDQRAHGLFLALPGINSHATGFYNENCRDRTNITLMLLQEEHVLEAIYQDHTLDRPPQVAARVTQDEGTPGDGTLLYTPDGFFWIQYVIPHGSGVPTAALVFDGQGTRISDADTLTLLGDLLPELSTLEVLNTTASAARFVASPPGEPEQIAEVQRSSSCFEYQYPAAPEFFVGRDDLLSEVDRFVDDVVNQRTSARGLLFLANSGWGKSSAVLACQDRLQSTGHFAIAIDCRSASTAQFILQVVNHVMHKYTQMADLLTSVPGDDRITGYEGALRTLVELGERLMPQGRALFIFLDQFESIFHQPNTLRPIRDLLLGLCNATTNVVLGFAWKLDLVGIHHEFPYDLRHAIMSSSKQLVLPLFSERETQALLALLSQELHAKLRGDLRFLLSESSRGYPWLLKRLCAHVKSQRDNGITQVQIARRFLNVEELFEEDVRDLDPAEEETLRSIAKEAPISIASLGEEHDSHVVQSLVDRRLLIRVATKYDVYWDIFRDYLTTGHIPVEENYLLRRPLGAVLRVGYQLAAHGGTLPYEDVRSGARLSEKSFFNVTHDMEIAGVVTTEGGQVRLVIHSGPSQDDLERALRSHLNDKLPRNRVARVVLAKLEANGELDTQSIAHLLAETCPYVSANEKSWKAYTHAMAAWLDFADLAILERKTGRLRHYDPTKEVREPRRVRLRHPARAMPQIQFRRVEEVAVRIMAALRSKTTVDWCDISPSTRTKSLAALGWLGFITRHPDRIIVRDLLIQFVDHPDHRQRIFRQTVQQLDVFVTFKEILDQYADERPTVQELGQQLKQALSAEWTDGTAKVHAKILLDWARAADVAPPILRGTRRR